MSYLTRASSLHGFNEFARSLQLNPVELLREAGLPRNVLDDPDALIAFHRFARVLELAGNASANPLFGLEFGLYQGVGIFGSLLYLVRNANNVGDALADLSRYFHVHDNYGDVRVHRADGLAHLYYATEAQNLPGSRHVSELVMGVGHQLMRTLLGSRWQPMAATFQHAPAASAARYRRLLGVAPRFNSAFDAWLFDARWLDISLTDADPALYRLMQHQLDAMSSQHNTTPLPNDVQRLLRSFLPSGRVTVDCIADFMSMSPRSLQRHLAEQGTSFQTLLDETRQAMTVRYLEESDMSLMQLTDVLGYANQSAFSRAFQRWFGVSPRQWLKQQTPRV
ncbi:AraC family transcriptional regulator [Pseudomonas sp.]|jgi:AraC-like DNA-binding protein|uniref:AraC family transcriptional regulator n=1 Tax=Pseudomonas sp. TaxID=306 RepID=UPI003BB5035C